MVSNMRGTRCFKVNALKTPIKYLYISFVCMGGPVELRALWDTAIQAIPQNSRRFLVTDVT